MPPGSTSYSFSFTDDRPAAGATADTTDTTSAGANPGAAGPSNPGAPDTTGAGASNPATNGPVPTLAPTPAPTVAITPAPTITGTINAVEIKMSLGGSQTQRVRHVRSRAMKQQPVVFTRTPNPTPPNR